MNLHGTCINGRDHLAIVVVEAPPGKSLDFHLEVGDDFQVNLHWTCNNGCDHLAMVVVEAMELVVTSLLNREQ